MNTKCGLLILLLLISSIAIAQQQVTPNLHLKLTSDATLNDDLYKLDDAIATLNRWTGGTGATPGPPYISTTTTTTTTSTTTTSTLLVPAALSGDTNCPATLPTRAAAGGGMLNTLWTAVTCPTPASPTTVAGVALWADNGTVGTHVKCSVYTFPPGYASGSTLVAKVAPGCDTIEGTIAAPNNSNWMTLATTGSCPLAASTRYLVGCNADNAYQIGYNNNTCTLGSVQCQQLVGTPYATAPLPATWTAGSQGTATILFAMGVIAQPTTTTVATTTTIAPTTSTSTTTTATTTTTLANPAADWTPSFLAVWRFEEASGTRVNAQGTATRNLVESPPPIAGNAVNFMEGIRSLQSTPGTFLFSTDASLANLTPPFSCLAWARADATTTGRLIENVSAAPSGWYLDYNGTLANGFGFGWTGGAIPGFTAATGTWVHIGISDDFGAGSQCRVYRNGTLVNSASVCGVATPDGTQSFKVGGATQTFNGQIDELACTNAQLPSVDFCRICSCQVNGALCACAGLGYANTGRNVSSCGSCALPANCAQATP